MLRVRLDLETGDFDGGWIVPVELRGRGIPCIDPDGKAVRLLRELTYERRGLAGILIEDDGRMWPALD